MPTIQLGHNFFKKELRSYSNFAVAFWRELIQNAVDANCSTIQISIQQEEGSTEAKIVFTDNGCGMTESVLNDVYFRLGETTKGDDESNIGGFGRARILTCFAHRYYKIHTLDNVVVGGGATYNISKSSEYVGGCSLEIEVDAVDNYEHRIDMKKALTNYLACCQLPCVVYINGEKYTEWMYRRQVAKVLDFGTVHANSNGRLNMMFVRVSGVMMFSKYVGCSKQVILEINPENSRSVLVSNRDSLSYRYEQELDRFISSLAVNARSALKEVKEPYSVYSGSNYFVEEFSEEEKEVEKQNNVEVECASVVQEKTSSLIDVSNGVKSDGFLPVGNNDEKVKFLENSIMSLANDLAKVIYVESGESKIRRIAKKYEEEKWEIGERNKRRDLHVLWTEACRFVVKSLSKKCKIKRIAWIPGFVFSDSAEAMHKSARDMHELLINPIDKDGTFKYNGLYQWETRAKILSLAIHEVTHIHCSNHDEDFCALNTELTGIVFSNMKEIKAKMDAVYELHRGVNED